MAALCFDLPFATMSLSRTQRMHWAKLHQHNKVVLATVRLLTKRNHKWWPLRASVKGELSRRECTRCGKHTAFLLKGAP